MCVRREILLPNTDPWLDVKESLFAAETYTHTHTQKERRRSFRATRKPLRIELSVSQTNQDTLLIHCYDIDGFNGNTKQTLLRMRAFVALT